MTDEVALRLALSADASKAVLIARRGLEGDLRRIAIRFSTSHQRSPNAIEVSLDDLLTNLAALNGWPSAAGEVVWEEALQGLVLDSISDAQAVESYLANGLLPYGEHDVAPILGDEWVSNLTSFQRRDVAKLLSLRHGANFSVPGAGKTRVGLAVFQAVRNMEGIERLLIVGPKSAYEAWLSENNQSLSKPLSMHLIGDAAAISANALIVNYERLPNMVDALARWLAERPSMMILDEAHRMKLGAVGAYGAACLALGPRSRRRLILTGTPAPNGARDLENLFGFVWPGTGRQQVTRAVGGANLAIASRALSPLYTRTTKHELQLPPEKTVIHKVKLPVLHDEIYKALVGQFSARAAGVEGDFQNLGRVTMYLLMAATSPGLLSVGSTPYEALNYRVPPLSVPTQSSLFELMQDLPAYEMSPKYQETLAIVSTNATLGKKTLVWSSFVRSLTTLGRLLAPFNPAVIHGGTTDRDEQVTRFRSDPDCMVLLSNPATLGEGISLHRDCHDAVFVDRDFAAGRFLQSLDRIHRLGLEQGVITNSTVLVAENTIDEVVASRLRLKLDFMGGVLDDPAVRQLADPTEESAVGFDLDQADLEAILGHLNAPSS